MNRDIKFRAWVIRSDNKDAINAMRYEGNSTLFGWIRDGVTLELMQFTGLKDKNGKEIYEGDTIDAWTSRFPASPTRGNVIWNEHCAAFQLQYEGAFGNNPTDFIHQWHFFEIVGNIYETPKLYDNNESFNG